MSDPDKDALKRINDLLQDAEAVLIGAGAGMTSAAGFSYLDKQKFAQVFPGWVRKGFSMQYELMGYPYWSQKEQWGYYKVHLTYMYFDQSTHPLYQSLYNLIKDKDYFVLTSNVDGLFYKNGFDRQRFYAPQGDYGKIQCTKPCTREVWDIKPFLDAMDDHFNPIEQVLTDDTAVPGCPNCGGTMFIHARVDGSFIDAVHELERQRMTDWLQTLGGKRVLLMDLGSGFNTPTIVRLPMEQIARIMPDATLIRVNLDNADLPGDLMTKGLSVKGDIKDFLEDLEKLKI